MNYINKASCILSDSCAIFGQLSVTKSISKQTLINNNTRDNINRYLNRSFTESFIDYSYIANNQTNQASIFEDSRLVCDCIRQSYDCKLFQKILQRNLIQNEALKNTYMGLYLIIMISAIIVNFALIILMLKTQEKSCCANLIKRITQHSGNSSNKSKTKRLNLYSLDNNMLLISLLMSYLMTIFYVLPRQLALFYTGIITHGIECKFTEFIKAFTVSLTIFSLVAISLQQLISLKYCTIMNSCSISFHNQSLSGFLKKIFQHKEFITRTLCVLSWLFAFTIGYLYMNPFEDTILVLESYDVFVQRPLLCKFPSYLKSKYEYCSIGSNFSLLFILLFVILLVIPNFIIFFSYGYICYHIWFYSRNLLTGYHNRQITAQEQLFYISIQNSAYIKVSRLNCSEILEVIQTHSTGILTQEQIISLFNTIKEKEYLTPVSIDIMFQPRYNGFQVETLIKAMDKSSEKKTQNNRLTTSNIIKKRNKTVTMTICLMAICFTLCWFPFFSFALFYSKIQDDNLYINLKVTIHLIGYSSSVWSPLIYILRCEKFKNTAKPLLLSMKVRFKNYINKVCKFKNESNRNTCKSIKLFKKRVNPDEY